MEYFYIFIICIILVLIITIKFISQNNLTNVPITTQSQNNLTNVPITTQSPIYIGKPVESTICKNIYMPVICPNNVVYNNSCLAQNDGWYNCPITNTNI